MQDVPLPAMLSMPVIQITSYTQQFNHLSKDIENMYCAIDDAATKLQQQQQQKQLTRIE